MIPRSGGSVQELCMLCIISNLLLNNVFDHHNFRLKTLNQLFLSPNFVEQYCKTIYDSVVLLQNFRGFVEGTLVSI